MVINRYNNTAVYILKQENVAPFICLSENKIDEFRFYVSSIIAKIETKHPQCFIFYL